MRQLDLSRFKVELGSLVTGLGRVSVSPFQLVRAT
jgi:hypothetical protein